MSDAFWQALDDLGIPKGEFMRESDVTRVIVHIGIAEDIEDAMRLIQRANEIGALHPITEH